MNGAWMRKSSLVCLLFLAAAAVPAQFRPVVQIDPLQNASGQAQLDALGTAIVDGIAFTLRLIGEYEVQTDSVPEAVDYDEASLSARAIEAELNNVIFGEISRTDDGGYLVTIAAYDQGVDAVVFEDAVAFDSVFDMRRGVVDTYEATDLEEVRFAYDEKYFYLLLRTADRTYERRNTVYKFHFDMQPGARVLIDVWPADNDGNHVWAGYESPGTDDGVGWGGLDGRTRIAFTNGTPQSVLEVAIPLKTLAGWRYFNRHMNRIWLAAEYIKSGDHTWVDSIESVPTIPFPTRALMLAENE